MSARQWGIAVDRAESSPISCASRSCVSRIARASALVVLALLASCGGDPVTQILVEIDAAEDVKLRTSFVRLRVEAAAAGESFAPVSELGDVTIPVSSDAWPRVHVLAPVDGDVTRVYRVTARALDTDFRTVAEARRQSGYVARETRVLRVFIPGGACLDLACPEDRTCEQGLCLEVPMIPPDLLPRPGDSVDGGTDAGMDDGGGDGGTCDLTSIDCTPEGECETAEVSCDSGEPVCVRTPLGADTVCRAAVGECDAEEACDGTSPVCPVDMPVEFGTECSTGFCFGQVCGVCSAGGSCDTGNRCEVGEIECGDDGAPTCTPMRAADPGTVCREAVGSCDVAETCQDTTCPADVRVAAGQTCRGATGPCDAAEVCDGTSPLCPMDAFRSSTTVCRASEGACDPGETCTGSGPTCPADVISASGTVCRGEVDLCDVSEVCDGSSRSCPANAFAPFGTSCGINPGFVCDGAGSCAASNCGDPCDTGRPCEEGMVECGAGEPVCVGKGPRAAGTVCRPRNGDCDVAEVCSGTSIDCPPDAFEHVTTTCRAPAGACDVAEVCTGTSPTCPTDVLRPSSFVCRASASGGCDRAETCSGSDPTCPSDTFLPNGTVCRMAEGACDRPEVCSGTSALCPTDTFRPSTEVCRAPAHSSCDIRELCTGTSRECPDDVGFDAGEVCLARPAGYAGVCAEPVSSGGAPWRCLDLVISEVRLGAIGFVELYNRFCQPVQIDDCILTIQGGSMGDRLQTVELSGEMAGGGFYLVGMGASSADIDAGSTLGTTLAASGSVKIELFCHRAQLDLVEVVTGPFSPESLTCSGFFGAATQSVERKAVMASTAMSMRPGGVHVTDGNAYNTQNPVADFVCQSGTSPQSSRSPAETPGCR